MAAQHAMPQWWEHPAPDHERLATDEERSQSLPARSSGLAKFRRLLPRRSAGRHARRNIRRPSRRLASTRAGSIISPQTCGPVNGQVPGRTQLAPLPAPLRAPLLASTAGQPRIIPQVATVRVSIWLPPAERPCWCQDRWGRCLLAQAREIMRHPVVDLAVDSIMMAAVR